MKELFREGKDVKILLGTDALSEGLNLQTCGQADQLRHALELHARRAADRPARPYRRQADRRRSRTTSTRTRSRSRSTEGIGEDVDWFEDVVGPAQPVLSQIEKAIEDVAMEAPGPARQRDVAAKISQIRASIEASKAEAINLSDLERDPSTHRPAREPAITLAGLEQVLTSVPATANRLRPHPDIAGAYLLDLPDRTVPVTFSRKVLDVYAPDIRLLTYRAEEFDRLLTLAGVGDVELDDGEFKVGGEIVRTVEELLGTRGN